MNIGKHFQIQVLFNKVSELLAGRLPMRLEALFLDLTLILLCGLAFSQGIRTTGDLNWPHEVDLYRDISQAQTIIDSHRLIDPLYLGEKLWYNPLVPTLVASVSWVTDLPVYVVYTRAGAYLNLLAPVSFYILIAYLFDRWTALASTLGFLFVIAGNLPFGTSATYSPWLLSGNFTQILFYSTLAVYAKTLSTEKRGQYVIVGILLGITFLGHTAPAIILGIIIGVFTLAAIIKLWRVGTTPYQPIVNFGIIIGLALIVSIPLLSSILGHYHLRILNDAPNSWVADLLVLDNVWLFMDKNLSIFTAFTCVGVIGLAVNHFKRIGGKILLLWGIISGGFLIYSYIWQIFQQNYNLHLPSIVPAFHFLFYLKAAEAAFFGYGVVIFSRFIFWLLGFLVSFVNIKLSDKIQHKRWLEKAILSGLLLIILLVAYPSYTLREDFVKERILAKKSNQWLDRQMAYTWIRNYTQPTDVFLTDETLGLLLVGPAGRKLVAIPETFSNPYVDWYRRFSDRELMVAYLAVGDQNEFSALATKYHVAYIITASGQHKDSLEHLSFLKRDFEAGKVRIYRVVN